MEKQNRHIKLLLVEDNPTDTQFIKKALNDNGQTLFDLECTDRLQGALERLDKNAVDEILLDLFLPDSQGFDTLRKVHAKTPNTPIVVLTVFKDETFALRMIQEGAQDYLVKGKIDSDILLRVLQYALERKRAETALCSERNKLQALIDGLARTGIGINVIGRDYKILFQNQPLQEKFGDFKGKLCYEAYRKLKKPCAKCSMVKAVKYNEVTSVELPSYDGRAYKIISAPLLNPDGSIDKAIHVVIDITEHKQAERERIALNKELMKSNKKLRQLVLKDSLTGFYNYRYLEEVMETEFHRAQRYCHPLSVIVLDIDYFKSINDVYGHQFGDLVLKQFSQRLKQIVRRYDIIIRLGGEEFMVISPGTDKSAALVLGQRLLDKINLYNFGDKKHNVKLRLSLAITNYPEDKIARGMDLVNLTDQIINRVKEHGGNRIYSYADLQKERRSVLVRRKEITEVKVLKAKIGKLTKQANQGLIEAIFAFSKTIEVKDHYTGEHVERTVYYATEIARGLNLSEDEVESVKQAAILHDLGKVGISEKVLLKRSRLTKEEFEEIKKHPQIGADIIRPIHLLRDLIPLILYHHERWDGKGYLTGLKGEEIPMGARIIALADVYQALTSDRPYRQAYPKDKAKEIIEIGAGTQFDPKIVHTFLRILQQEK